MKLFPINYKKRIKFGLLKAKIIISKDSDAPLPDEIIDDFSGKQK